MLVGLVWFGFLLFASGAKKRETNKEQLATYWDISVTFIGKFSAGVFSYLLWEYDSPRCVVLLFVLTCQGFPRRHNRVTVRARVSMLAGTSVKQSTGGDRKGGWRRAALATLLGRHMSYLQKLREWGLKKGMKRPLLINEAIFNF